MSYRTQVFSDGKEGRGLCFHAPQHVCRDELRGWGEVVGLCFSRAQHV